MGMGHAARAAWHGTTRVTDEGRSVGACMSIRWMGTGGGANRQWIAALTVPAIILAAALVLARPGPAVAATTPAAEQAVPASWARADMRFAARHRLLPRHVTSGNPHQPITRQQWLAALQRTERLRQRLHGGQPQLAGMRQGARLRDARTTSVAARSVRAGWFRAPGRRFAPRQPLTSNEAARSSVGMLGLGRQRNRLAGELRRVAPRGVGDHSAHASQVMARSLGLYHNHPAGRERFEVAPTQSLTRAHAAFMLRRVAMAEPWRVERAARYGSMRLPRMRPNEQRLAARAISLVGTPYVWAGNTELPTPAQPGGVGGMDCSGFVLRVLGDAGVPAGQRHVVAEHTSMDMSARPRSQRVGRRQLRPGDLVFWGDRGPRSAPSANFHAGMWLGNGWFIHSAGSNGGVSIDRVEGFWQQNLSWGRRTLRRR